MAFAPVITRLYGPEAFGLLGTFMAILMVLTPMAALTYPIAIVLPKHDADAKGLARLSMLLAVATSSLALILILTWGDWFAGQFGAEAISQYLWLIPFAMLFSALHQVVEQWLIRHRQFRITARVAVLQSMLLNSAKAGAGLLLPLAGVLIILQTLTSGLHTLLLWLGGRSTSSEDSEAPKPISIKQLAFKHRDFPFYRAPQVTINALAEGMPVLILAALFGPIAAGYYTLSKSVMSMPVGLLGKSVSDVFYPRITEAINKKEQAASLLIRATLLLAVAGVVPFFMVFAFGPYLFSLIFGMEWGEAGEFARWLAIWLFVSLIARPAISAIPALGMQKMFLFFEVLALPVRCFSVFFGGVVVGSASSSIIFLSLSNFFLYGALVLVAVYRSRSVEI